MWKIDPQSAVIRYHVSQQPTNWVTALFRGLAPNRKGAIHCRCPFPARQRPETRFCLLLLFHEPHCRTFPEHRPRSHLSAPAGERCGGVAPAQDTATGTWRGQGAHGRAGVCAVGEGTCVDGWVILATVAGWPFGRSLGQPLVEAAPCSDTETGRRPARVSIRDNRRTIIYHTRAVRDKGLQMLRNEVFAGWRMPTSTS